MFNRAKEKASDMEVRSEQTIKQHKETKASAKIMRQKVKSGNTHARFNCSPRRR